MKTETLLRTVLFLLVVALAVTITSWVSSSQTGALADGGGGGGGDASGDWMMVASELSSGEGLVYMFHTKKEVLLVYAYHRGRKAGSTKNRFDGDLQFLAGRNCKWDLLFSQQTPYPMEKPPSGMHTPKEMEDAFNKVNK